MREKIYKYLIESNLSFYDNGKADIFLESLRYKKLGLRQSIYSLPLKGRKDKHSFFGYSLDPMADTVSEMANRIFIF